MNKLGMHVHGIKPGIIRAVELLQPRTITIMDPSAQEIRDIYAVADPVAVVRKYEDGRNFQQVDPGWWAEEYYRMVGDAASDRLIALGMNEPFGHAAQPLCAPFDEWNRVFIERCRELGPMDGGALAMATGNWTGADDRYKITDDFPGTSEIARFFLPHEYCWPTLEIGVPWYTLRYRAWIEDLEAIGREDFSFIISEAGLTQAIIAGRPDEGWRSGGPEGVTEDSYIATIDWYNARLCEDWRVLGCCLYDWAGSHYGWETFEQLGLEQRIYQIQAPGPPEPPEPPPNGGDHMEIRDMADQIQDEEWLHSLYGVNWERAQVEPGQKVYRLVLLREKEGPSSLVTQVVDGNDVPIEGVDVAFYWSGAPDPPEPPTEVYPHDWYYNFVHGPTNVNGDVGPGMGIGAYHGLGECGPHQVWIRDSDILSDRCYCLGMLAGTAHRHMNQLFKLVTHEGEEPPEPPENGILDEILAEAKAARANTIKILSILGEEEELPDPPVPPEPEKKTFTVQYFNTVDLSGPVIHEMEEPLFEGDPFFWHEGVWLANLPSVNEYHVSGRWSGTFTFEAGVYRFNILTDDGARLRVGGNKVLDKWYPQSPTLHSVSVTLAAGLHEVVLEWFQAGGGATLHFTWQ